MSMGFGGPLLFDRINLHIEKGERTCLVGRNGEGKTTLLNIISSSISPDEGEIYRRPGLRIASLAQELPSGLDGSVFDITAGGLEIPEALPPEAGNRVGGEEIWKKSTHVNKILTRLKLDPASDFKTLSAGLKRRVLFARALAGSPDVLLLDEPTNHMDIQSIDLIEEFLLKFSGTLLFVTHDRIFLQKIATRIIEIDRANATSWACGYEIYLKRKAEFIETEVQQNRRFDKKLEKEEEWTRKGIKARRTRNEGRARALLKMREERRNRRSSVKSAKMQLQEAERTGKLVIEAKNVSFAYDGKSAVQDFSVTVMRGDRVGIIGPNGSGKTTLLGLMLKKFSPDKGSIRHGTKLEISYFDQTREQLDEEKTVQDNVADGSEIITINKRRRHVIGYLKDFLFSPDRARSPVKTLSGGERNRLLLARLFTRPSNVLVMDEPTNDLDTPTLELLEDLLLEYSGTLLLVTHDRAFLNNVVTSTLVFEGNGKVVEYVGGYDDWLHQRKQEQIPKKQLMKHRGKKSVSQKAENRKLGYMEERELEALPEQIEAMEKEQDGLFSIMADPDFYRKNGDKIANVKTRQQELENLLKDAYVRWEELEARVIN